MLTLAIPVSFLNLKIHFAITPEILQLWIKKYALLPFRQSPSGTTSKVVSRKPFQSLKKQRQMGLKFLDFLRYLYLDIPGMSFLKIQLKA